MAVTKNAEADKYAHLTNQVRDLSSVSQALQIDVQHAVKVLDKLVLVADKQTELAHELSRHSDSFERVFASVDNLATVLKEDRDKAAQVAETVTGYKTGLRTAVWALSTIGVLVVIIWSMFTAQMMREQQRSNDRIAETNDNLERRKVAVDLKIDTVKEQVQDLKLSLRQDRDNQARQNIP
jgi:hypothetical protein